MIFINKLPKIYQNNIKNVNNNKEVYYDEINKDTLKDRSNDSNDINTKLINIFKNTKSVYKIKVDITKKNGVVTKYIVGRLPGKIVTLDNESIPLDEIIDIKISD